MGREDANVDELTARARARVGTRVRDKWQLDALLGVGGMAAVYAATHRNGKRVAMKVLHKEAMNDESRQRFTREGYVANTIGHAGAVSVIDDDVTEDGAPYFTMDLLEGETLDQRVRRKGKLAVTEVLAAAWQLLDVLAVAHRKGIVHRDIKPENVFLTRDAKVKVLDFGIAHLTEFNGTLTGVTQSGHTMGTPSFMPPEQARGRWDQVDAQSDLWAVGATLFTCLTGRHVHEAETMNEVLLAAMTVGARPIGSLRPDLPPAVQDAVDRSLAFAKGDRWANAKAMQDAVREAYRAMKQSAEDPGHEPTLASPSSGPALPAPPTSAPRGTMFTTAQRTSLPSQVQLHGSRMVSRTKLGVAVGTAVGVLLAVILTRFALPVQGGEVASGGDSAGAIAVDLAGPQATPPASASGPTVTVLPAAELKPPPVPRPVAAAPLVSSPVPPRVSSLVSSPAPARAHPRHAAPVAAAPAPLAPAEPVAPPSPPGDPLTRRH